MASIIAAKTADVQYAIVGTCQNLEKQVQPDYNVGYVALTGTGMPLGEGSGTAFDTSFTALQSAFVAATDAAE